MPVGLDLNPYSLRLSHTEPDTGNSFTYYGIQGIVPRWNEPIIWTDSLSRRSSTMESAISLADLWWRFSQDHKAIVQYTKNSEVDSISVNASELICEAVSKHLPRFSEEYTVLAVDNLLPEFQQSALLRSMGNLGFGRRELLWRPIALALAHMESFEVMPYDDGDQLLVVDTDSYIPEMTVLTLKTHRGHLVPLRDYPSVKRESRDQPFEGYNARNIIHEFISYICDEDINMMDQLSAGPFSPSLFQFLDSGEPQDIWIRKGLNHKKLSTETSWLERLSNTTIEETGFPDLLNEVEAIEQKTKIKATLFNGMIARLHTNELGEYILMPHDSVSTGAAEYGRRRQAGIPGYLDTLPGLKIMGKDEEQRSVDFHVLIEPGVLEGGEKRRSEPRTEFSLEEETSKFTAVLNNVAEDSYRQYLTLLPEVQHSGLIPLILNAETQPGQGHAKVTIQGASGYEDVFGDIPFIELDWESGKPFERPVTVVYAGPEHYPVRGRIADDPDCLSVARQFVEEDMHIGSQVRFRNRAVGYMRVHETWGYNDPFGSRLGEPTRALFGAMVEEDPEILELAQAIGEKIQSSVRSTRDRHKYLNYMFRYAPESFREELRHLFSIRNPDLNWNTVYAVGRTFYKREDFELFLDFFLRKSENSGFPDYHDEQFIPAYFWSFFRGLCYYEETAEADRVKVEGVLNCVYNYSAHCAGTRWPGGFGANVIKYLLSGILFSLRLRKHHHDFLEPDSELYTLMRTAVSDLMPQIPYPPTMFETVQQDRLNDYVLRFMDEQQTVDDLAALQGLVISMS